MVNMPLAGRVSLVETIRLLRGEDVLEHLGVVGGDAGEDFAVQLDMRGFELGDKLGVGGSCFFGGRTDADGPQAAHRALFLLAVGELERPRVQESFLCCAVLC